MPAAIPVYDPLFEIKPEGLLSNLTYIWALSAFLSGLMLGLTMIVIADIYRETKRANLQNG